MAYDLKNVFYLGNLHEYSDSYTASGEGIAPIDVSSYVDPISKGRSRGQGLAVYKVHCQVSTEDGTAPAATETASIATGLSVKPYTTTGDELAGQIAYGDLSPSSDLLIYGAQWIGPAAAAAEGAGGMVMEFCSPSKEVPYVVVRDTIYQLYATSTAQNADILVNYRMECAMITLDTATLNQLLRTQTA